MSVGIVFACGCHTGPTGVVLHVCAVHLRAACHVQLVEADDDDAAATVVEHH